MSNAPRGHQYCEGKVEKIHIHLVNVKMLELDRPRLDSWFNRIREACADEEKYRSAAAVQAGDYKATSNSTLELPETPRGIIR